MKDFLEVLLFVAILVLWFIYEFIMALITLWHDES